MPTRRRQVAEDPAVDVAQGLGLAQLEEGLDGGEHGGDRHPGEQQGRRGALASGHAEAVGEGDGDERPGERRDRDVGEGPGGALGAGGDGDGGAEARACRDAEQVRVGERVPEHALVRAAGERQGAPDQQTERDPRRAHLPDDRRVDRAQRDVEVEPGEAVDQLQDLAARARSGSAR